MRFSFEQLMYVACIANKKGGKGQKLISVIPPTRATQGDYDFLLVFETPETQSAGDKDWRD